MTNDLTGFSAGGTKTHTIGDGVQARFKQLKKVLTCLTFAAISLGECPAELAFEDAVNATNLLFGTQMYTIV